MSKQKLTVERILENNPGAEEWVRRHYVGVESGAYVWEIDGERVKGADQRVVRAFEEHYPEVTGGISDGTMIKYLSEMAHLVTGDSARPGLRGRRNRENGEGGFTVKIDGPGMLYEGKVPRELVPRLIDHLL